MQLGIEYHLEVGPAGTCDDSSRGSSPQNLAQDCCVTLKQIDFIFLQPDRRRKKNQSA